MNQTPRYAEKKCYVCKKAKVLVKQTYNPQNSSWEEYEMPTCEECRQKEIYGGK